MKKRLVARGVLMVVLLASVGLWVASGWAGEGAAPTGPSADPVLKALESADKAAPSASGGSVGPAVPPKTLDDYQQDRWRIKLERVVPSILWATPIILVIILVAMRLGMSASSEHLMLSAALVLVIQATLVVSLTAEGSDALSASMGILGAIAGYLFGRAQPEGKRPQLQEQIVPKQ